MCKMKPVDKANPIDRIDTFMGVDGRGECLPGPYRPFGMVRIGPDVVYPQHTNGYRTIDGQTGVNAWLPKPIEGFSHTHVAGTGGCSRYGNVQIIPFSGEPRIQAMAPILAVPVARIDGSHQENEEGRVGYYACTLNPYNIRCELTCTQHVGLHRYTFSAEQNNHLLLNAGSVIQTGLAAAGHIRRAESWDSEAISVGGTLERISDTELAGRADLRGGWGHDKPYSVYFFLRSDAPFTNVQFAHQQGQVLSHIGAICCGPEGQALCALPEGVQQVNLQVGISFVSIAKAQGRLASEVGEKSFENIVAESQNEWSGWFDRLRVSGGEEKHQSIFYSLLYRLLCQPTDLGVDDENPAWQSGVHQFWDYYCLWDSIRNANSLYALFAPELHRDMINGLIDVAEQTGWLPDAWIAGHHAYAQGGCSCDILIAEAAAKNIQGVDYANALSFMRKNNETAPPDPVVMGRFVDDYHQLGYCSTRTPCSVSRHIEYTYHDWCIADLAHRLGDKTTASTFYSESEKIWNLWDAKRSCFAAKLPDGSWDPNFDPDVHIRDCWCDPYCYEGTSRHWSLSVFQDFHGQIERFGGADAFVEHLDEVFAEEEFHATKETRMHYPWLYIYAGRPDRAAERVHESLMNYRLATDGLPDNEDMGCQSGFFIWGSMGLYPIIGQDLYLLTAPLFEQSEIDLGESGNSLILTAENPGMESYVQSATLNGEPLNRAWLRHEEIADGAQLHFICGPTPSDWGKETLPPNGL